MFLLLLHLLIQLKTLKLKQVKSETCVLDHSLFCIRIFLPDFTVSLWLTAHTVPNLSLQSLLEAQLSVLPHRD